MNTPLTIASWNIFQGLHHSSRRDQWVQNLALEDHLTALDVDVLVLPEAWQFRRVGADWAEQLAARLGYELHQWIADRPTRDRDIVPWRIVMMSRIPMKPLPTHVMPAARGLGQRAIVRAELADSGLIVGAAHLHGIHLLLDRAPRAWMKERAELRLACAANDIVTGDLNMWGPIVQRDAGTLRPAVKGRTFKSQRPHSQIDHMLVSERVEVLASDVLPDQGSDHRAIRAKLQKRP